MIPVVCKTSFFTRPVYSNVFAHVQRRRSSKTKTMSSYPSNLLEKTNQLSVVIIGIDSMSRSNMIRQMPKSLRYLEDKMNGITFQGFTKVGDNTWVNLLAVLTGLRSFPTKEYPADLPQTETIFFDNYAEYIWKNFSRAGYVTFFGEDRPDIQDFNYGIRLGFKNLPTDHYDRPMWLSMWWSFLHMRSSAFCYGLTPEHEFLFNYLRKFLRVYRDDRSYALIWWQNLSHDLLNKISSADDDFVEFLQSIETYLNNTVLFVMSDHGHRYDAIRQTVIGRLEARMPHMTVVVPPWFQAKYSEAFKNLKLNSDRLTTPFDVYATTADILYGTVEQIPSAEINTVPSYAVSFFKPVSPKRNCKDARIPEEYCPCYHEIALDPSVDVNVFEAADVLLMHVNHLLKDDQPPCAVLKLAKVRDAFIFLPHQGTMHDIQVGNRIPKGGFYLSYRIVIETSPGGALLEGIVKHFLDNGALSVDGDVDRNNAYGNQSYCVTNILLRKYCYCLNFVTP